MKGVQGTEIMLCRISKEQPRRNGVILINHLLNFELPQTGTYGDLAQEGRSGFLGKETSSLLDPSNRNRFNHAKFRDENNPVGFAENTAYAITTRFSMIALGECAGIEEIAHVLAMAAGADDLVREGPRHVAEQFHGFFERRDAIHLGNLGPTLSHEFVIDQIVKVVEWLNHDRYAFVFGKSQRLYRVEDAVLINRFNTSGHDSSLDDFLQVFLWL